jgi:uncharacterized protein (DUF2461 family)
MLSAMVFGGFPADGFGFYVRLEADNSRRFWDAHKTEYQRYVREPMAALAGELEAEFGPATACVVRERARPRHHRHARTRHAPRA